MKQCFIFFSYGLRGLCWHRACWGRILSDIQRHRAQPLSPHDDAAGQLNVRLCLLLDYCRLVIPNYRCNRSGSLLCRNFCFVRINVKLLRL